MFLSYVKPYLYMLLFFCTVANAPAQPQIYKLADDLTVRQIDDNVWLAVHSFPWAANSLIIKFADGEYLFIDTPYTDEASEQLISWLAERDTTNFRMTVINTHFHVDNLGSNSCFKKHGAAIYGSTLTAQLLKERGLGNGMLKSFEDPTYKKYYDYYKTKQLTPPEKLFDINKELTLLFSGDSIEVYYPGPGHTPDNIIVYYPAKKILFGGCIFKSMESKTKGNIGDADLKNWQFSLANILKKYPGAKIIVPGHGAPGSIELINHSIEIVKQ